MASSAMKLPIGVFGSLPHTPRNKKTNKMAPHDIRTHIFMLSSPTVWFFIHVHVYLHAQIAVDAGNICTWWISHFEYPNLDSLVGNENGVDVWYISRLCLWHQHNSQHHGYNRNIEQIQVIFIRRSSPFYIYKKALTCMNSIYTSELMLPAKTASLFL